MKAKQIITAGLFGGVVLLAWLIVSRTLFPTAAEVPKAIDGDKEVHSALKQWIPESGMYYAPGSSEDNTASYADYGSEPLYIVIHSGRNVDEVLSLILYEFIAIFLSAIVAALMLSMVSDRILSTYIRRVTFVALIGLLIGIYGNLGSEKPMDLILLSSVNLTVAWALAGCAIAWRIKGPTPDTNEL